MLSRKLRTAAAARTIGNEIVFVTALSQSQTTGSPKVFTFSNVNLGSTFYGRRIFIVVGFRLNNAASPQAPSATLAGQAMQTQGAFITNVPPIYRGLSYFSIADATTALGDISITFSGAGTSDHCVVHVYSVATSRSFSPSLTGLGSFTPPFQITRTLTTGQLTLAAGYCSDTASVSWTNTTERATTGIAGQFKLSTATYYPAVAGARTFTFTPSVTTNVDMNLVVI
jgi:hypothetical protein